jgi:hypothetical protein
MQIINEKIKMSELTQMAKNTFGVLVKAVVDVDRELIAIDAELHSDLETLLLQDGSKQLSLWGINLYPEADLQNFIEFDSMINMRPSQNNCSRGVENEAVRRQIKDIIAKMVDDDLST